MKKLLLIAVLLIVAWATPIGAQSSSMKVCKGPVGAPLFSDDFETDDTDLVPTWDAHGGAGDAPTLNTNPTYAHGGNNSGRFHYGTSSNNAWVSKLLAERTHFFMRGYVYFKTPEGGEAGTGAQRKLIWVGDENTPTSNGRDWDIILDTWESNAGPPSTLRLSWLSQGGACHGSSPQDYMGSVYDINWDTWYSLEIEAQLNTPVVDPGPYDGIFRVWLNGTLRWERTDAKINGNCTTPFTFYSIGRAAEGVVDEYRYWDDVKISASQIGP